MDKIDFVIENLEYAKLVKEEAHKNELIDEAVFVARELKLESAKLEPWYKYATDAQIMSEVKLRGLLGDQANAETKNEPSDDLTDAWREIKQLTKERKDAMGMTCPDCAIRLPKAHPKILMPNQRCWCGYIDRRERP
jgi:hypothetical protein